VKQAVRRHWHERAATFDDVAHHGLHTAEQAEAWRVVLRRLATRPGLRVLDVGSGTGFLSLLLAEMGNAVDGIDIAPAMVERAQQKAAERGLSATFSLGDAEALNAADSIYDLLVERHVLWTLPHPAEALVKWRRVLRPGGRIGLVEGDWRTQANEDYLPVRDALPLFGGRPSADVIDLVAAAGYVDVEVEPLMDTTLWGEEVTRERYLVTAVRPD
jgi:ubiquinone/menaquinone biosynthesis C-methylase UbiE